ncbi:MAG: hypothetical protein ACP5NM_11455 [Thiomonas sp.]
MRRTVQVAGRSWGVPLYRVVCRHGDCGFKTGTLYPDFVTPGCALSSLEREMVLTMHIEQGASWTELAESIGYSVKTLRRWARQATRRAEAGLNAETAAAVLQLAPQSVLDEISSPSGELYRALATLIRLARRLKAAMQLNGPGLFTVLRHLVAAAALFL